MSKKTLRDCVLLARAFYKSGSVYKKAIWQAIDAFKPDGLCFSFSQVSKDWARLRKERPAQLVLPLVEEEITFDVSDNGFVTISQGYVSVTLLEEEARDQYPFLFEEN